MADRERIQNLISRNDFNTAETLMRKSQLHPEERRALEGQIENRKRFLERERLRKQRRERFACRLQKFNLRAWKFFLAVFVITGMVTACCNHSASRSSLGSYGGPPVQQSPLLGFLNLLAVLDMAVFWGLVVLEAFLTRSRWSLERFRGVFAFWLLMLVLFLLVFLRLFF